MWRARCGCSRENLPELLSQTLILHYLHTQLFFVVPTIGGAQSEGQPPPFPIPYSFLKKLFSRLIDVLCSKYLKRGIWHFARKNTVWCGHDEAECQNPFSRIFCNANMPFAPFNTSSSSYMHNQTISNRKNSAFRHFFAGIGDFCSSNEAQYISLVEQFVEIKIQ